MLNLNNYTEIRSMKQLIDKQLAAAMPLLLQLPSADRMNT